VSDNLAEQIETLRETLERLERQMVAMLQAAAPGLNYSQLAELWHQAYNRQEADKRTFKDVYGPLIALIEKILTQRLDDSGATAFNTPAGTIHFVTRTYAKIMDPQKLWAWVSADPANRGPYLDLKANMSNCRAYRDEYDEPVPGVELSPFKSLSITSPKRGKPDVE